MKTENGQNTTIPIAPKGLAILAIVGPAFVWCAEYIGSGEVILATRMGAISRICRTLGTAHGNYAENLYRCRGCPLHQSVPVREWSICSGECPVRVNSLYG